MERAMSNDGQSAVTQKIFETMLGPWTPEYEQYLKKQTRIDMESIVGPNIRIADHYRLEDSFALIEPMARCYFEGRNIQFTKDDVFLTSFPKCGECD